MTICLSLDEFEKAWIRQYERLVNVYKSILPAKEGTVVELGCGRGQLTIPLAKALSRYRFVCVDLYPTPYSRGLKSLLSAISDQRELKDRIKVIVADSVKWLPNQHELAYDAAISNEFLCEVNRTELRAILVECYRVLKSGGVCVHSFLSPIPRNRGQRLLVEANVQPKWALFPPKEWFSPDPRFVMDQMKTAGFKRLATTILRSDLVVRAEAAQAILNSWNIRKTFWKAHADELTTEGIEFPDWVIVAGHKAQPR